MIAQAIFKNRHRQQILNYFPKITFVWVQADGQLIERRLNARKDYPASKSYGEMVNQLFEIPNIPYEVLVNNSGKEEVVEQIAQLLAKHEILD